MPSRESLAALLFCSAFFTVIWLRTAVYHLFCLGKSNTRIKKLKNQFSFLQKLSMRGYVQACKYHATTARRLYYVNLVYVFAMAICILLWLLSCLIPAISRAFSISVLLKLFLLDIPVNIFSFFMTKYAKSGGITWRWTKEN